MNLYQPSRAGRIAEDFVYKNVMEKFRWGNFDKMRLFVDRSYAPSVQSFHLVMLRTAEKMLDKGDNTLVVRLSNANNIEWRCWAFSCVVREAVR